jgi:hypothetical protein
MYAVLTATSLHTRIGKKRGKEDRMRMPHKSVPKTDITQTTPVDGVGHPALKESAFHAKSRNGGVMCHAMAVPKPGRELMIPIDALRIAEVTALIAVGVGTTYFRRPGMEDDAKDSLVLDVAVFSAVTGTDKCIIPSSHMLRISASTTCVRASRFSPSEAVVALPRMTKFYFPCYKFPEGWGANDAEVQASTPLSDINPQSFGCVLSSNHRPVGVPLDASIFSTAPIQLHLSRWGKHDPRTAHVKKAIADGYNITPSAYFSKLLDAIMSGSCKNNLTPFGRCITQQCVTRSAADHTDAMHFFLSTIDVKTKRKRKGVKRCRQ